MTALPEPAPAPPPSPAPALRIRGLRYRYPDGTEALSGLDLDVAEGESVGLIGPNGAGKSTLLLHLSGLLRPESGTVEVFGLKVERPNFKAVRRLVGLVFQDPDDQLFMPTVFDDVAFGPLNLGLGPDEVRARVKAALEEVGAARLADRAPYHLSGGEKRAVAIATVLSMEARLLALDEPSVNLDPRGRRELISLLERLGRTMLVVSHDLELVLETCGRVAILDGGRAVADGPVRRILADEALLKAHALERPHAIEHLLARHAHGKPPAPAPAPAAPPPPAAAPPLHP